MFYFSDTEPNIWKKSFCLHWKKRFPFLLRKNQIKKYEWNRSGLKVGMFMISLCLWLYISSSESPSSPLFSSLNSYSDYDKKSSSSSTFRSIVTLKPKKFVTCIFKVHTIYLHPLFFKRRWKGLCLPFQQNEAVKSQLENIWNGGIAVNIEYSFTKDFTHCID